MKKNIIVTIIFAFSGFVGGIYALLRFIVRFEDMLIGFKKDIVNKIEYLLFGYNTIKTMPYSHYAYKRYGRRTPSFSSYYSKSFDNDEEEEE